MKCFSCGKVFDYDKFYGICPKCGAYNKRETQEEAHQEMHDVYDGGYTHSHSPKEEEPFLKADREVFGTAADMNEMSMEQYTVPQKKKGTKFLIVSICIFLLVMVLGTAAVMAYFAIESKRIQKRLIESEVSIKEEQAGSTFSFQNLELCAEEAQVLATGEDLNLPPGKKLIAVRITGRDTSDDIWSDESRLEDAYITVGKQHSWQISRYDYEDYGEVYKKPALDPYDFWQDELTDGWIAFLLDEKEDSFTLCLEERSGESLVDLKTIHQIRMKLEGGE